MSLKHSREVNQIYQKYDGRVYKIYIGTGYLQKYGVHAIIEAISHTSLVVENPANADILLFPVLYEVLFEYKKEEYEKWSYYEEEITHLKVLFYRMLELGKAHSKKVIIFYYRDPVDKLEFENVIVFRTSLLKSQRKAGEYAMPAYMKDIISNEQFGQQHLLLKSTMPTVGFRGQAAPVHLPIKTRLRIQTNKVLKLIGSSKQVNLYYIRGYMARRNAIVSCLKSRQINTDITVTTLAQSDTDYKTSKKLFSDNLLNNQYNICSSGFGNYSYRLYETMSAGRIPVFINTDCVLPFEEFLDWKKHVVWVEEDDAIKASKCILEFHNSLHPDDFLQLQKDNRKLWEQYFCEEGFFKNLDLYFPIIDKIEMVRIEAKSQ
jgi:hypothetical protein